MKPKKMKPKKKTITPTQKNPKLKVHLNHHFQLNHNIEKDNTNEIQGILEKNKSLENELELERNNVKAQTEKLNNLRKEFTLLNAKS